MRMLMPEGAAFRGSDIPPAMTISPPLREHSPGSIPHPDGDGLRQVSWLALRRRPGLPRYCTQWQMRDASALTVAGAATAWASPGRVAFPYSLLPRARMRNEAPQA